MTQTEITTAADTVGRDTQGWVDAYVKALYSGLRPLFEPSFTPVDGQDADKDEE